MARVEESVRGLVRAELCGPEPEKLLNACLAENLPLIRPESLDRWTLRLGVYEGDLPRLEALAANCGCELRILSRRGGSSARIVLRRRFGLLISALAMLALLLVSSLFVWEIRLVGAEELSRGELLRELEESGLAVGCFWPRLDADALRDRMLLREPKLAWLAVNIRGSTAEVRLLRRADKPEIWVESKAADLRAGRAGVVRSLSVRSGQPLVRPGQAVTEGEILVSGTVDSITAEPRALRAQGEVRADTWYELTALCPPAQQKESTGAGRRERFALKIGGKRINFYQNAGKTIDGCDKIVHEYTLGIEGLFRLPLCLVCEELRPYRSGGAVCAPGEELGQRLLASLAEQIEGEIVSSGLSETGIDGMTVVTLWAQCRENIARSADLTP
ncbi:MAG: sporulation protein YqfD [Clostridia bacterium]